MKKLMILLAVVAFLDGCATYDRAMIWGYETFVDDSLAGEGAQNPRTGGSGETQ